MSWFRSIQEGGDVSKTSPANNDLLKYSSTTRIWELVQASTIVPGTATYALTSGTATYSLLSATATYAVLAATSTYGMTAGTATYATNLTGVAATATFAVTAGTATYATNLTGVAATATYAITAGTATYAILAGTATYALSAGGTPATATFAITAGTASWALNGATATYALTSGFASGVAAKSFLASPTSATGTPTYRIIAVADIPTLNQDTTGTATFALTAGTATYATNLTGIAATATFAVTAGTATYATNLTGVAATATFAVTSGTSTYVTWLATSASRSFLATPTTATGNISLRAILLGDLPTIATATFAVTSGTATWATNLSGVAATATFAVTSGTATWATNVVGGIGVTSVAQTVPSGFGITGSPITGTGTLALAYAVSQASRSFLATPTAATGAMSLRVIVAADVPTATYAITAGTATWALTGATSTFAVTSGTATYVSNAAQTAITSLGTLSTLITQVLTLATATHINGLQQHLRCVLISPNAAVTLSTTFCLIPLTDAALTVTQIDVTCDADPVTELDGDLKVADAYIGLANARLVNDFDTTAGIRQDTTIASGAVASGKCMYLSFASVPIAALKVIAFDIMYAYD